MYRITFFFSLYKFRQTFHLHRIILCVFLHLTERPKPVKSLSWAHSTIPSDAANAYYNNTMHNLLLKSLKLYHFFCFGDSKTFCFVKKRIYYYSIERMRINALNALLKKNKNNKYNSSNGNGGGNNNNNSINKWKQFLYAPL